LRLPSPRVAATLQLVNAAKRAASKGNDMQVIGLCRFSYLGEGGFQLLAFAE